MEKKRRHKKPIKRGLRRPFEWLGILLGMQVKEEARKPVRIGAASVFFLTYIPLMAKFYRSFKEV